VTPPAGAEGDKSLPDPTERAARWAAGSLLVAAGLALLINGMEWTAAPFDPAKESAANFALFAGFYVGAQVIERLMEFVAPALPYGDPGDWLAASFPKTDHRFDEFWKLTPEAQAARSAQIKADRAKVSLGVAAILGVAASGFFGLFFLQSIGMDVSSTVDTLVTGVTIAAGTKPLHDFISNLQNKDNAKTETLLA
jgi:hypothetical protein